MFCGISLHKAARGMAFVSPVWVFLAGATLVQARDFPVPPGLELTGEVIAEVFPATGGKRLIRETGSGEALFVEDTPGEVTFTARSEIADRGGISFSARLKQGEDGIWREVLADSQTSVTSGGRISGITDTGSELVTMSGIAGKDRLLLEIRHYPHPFGPEGETADVDDLLEIRFFFDLRTPSQPAASDGTGLGGDGGKGNGCRQIQWQTRASPNIFGGGVDLIQVPVCIP